MGLYAALETLIDFFFNQENKLGKGFMYVVNSNYKKWYWFTINCILL